MDILIQNSYINNIILYSDRLKMFMIYTDIIQYENLKYGDTL